MGRPRPDEGHATHNRKLQSMSLHIVFSDEDPEHHRCVFLLPEAGVFGQQSLPQHEYLRCHPLRPDVNYLNHLMHMLRTCMNRVSDDQIFI
jgi:hypothetical protein